MDGGIADAGALREKRRGYGSRVSERTRREQTR